MSEQPGRYQRSPSGLIGAMLVLLLVIVAFIGFRAFTRGDQDVPPPAVEYTGLAEQVHAQGALVAPAPEPLPEGWRVTSARAEGRGDQASWHLGVLTPKQTYVAVEEQRVRPGEIVAAFLGRSARSGGTTEIDGGVWRTWKADKGFALTLTTPRSTVYVGGPAGERAVLELTRTLDLRGVGQAVP